MATVGNTALQLIGVDKLQDKIRQLGARLPEVLGDALEEGAYMALAHMKETYLTSGPLYVQSGKLRGNWQVRQLRTGSARVQAQVSTNTKYARVHNYGFAGPVTVKEHIRRLNVSRSRAPGSRRGDSQSQRLRFRGASRRARSNSARREQASRAAHGLSLRDLQARNRGARRARGFQGGIEPLTGKLADKARGRGAVVVRSHGRFMKVRGHLYVERTLRDMEQPITRLVQLRIQQAIDR